MTLWFVRSRRWGNAYVFAVLDVLFAILWLAAFASVAAFNGQTGFLKEDDAAATEEPAPATAEEAVKMLMRRIMSRRRDVPADNDAPAEEQKPEGVEMPTCTGACGVTKAMVGFGFFILFVFRPPARGPPGVRQGHSYPFRIALLTTTLVSSSSSLPQSP